MDMPIHFRNVRNSLVLLVLLVIFPSMVGLIFYVLSEQQREARLQAQETALRIARLAAREQERLITGTQHLLITLAELPEVRERKAAKCSELFAAFMKKFPYYTNLAAATPGGDIFCSGLPQRSNNPNIADRGYFQEAVNERRLGISHVLVGRMSGKANISIAYPSFDPDGPVHAVVFVGLDLGWLNNIAAEAQLPPQARLLALDENGNVFVRYSEGQQEPGSAVDTSLVRKIIEHKEGFTAAEGPDGVRRLFGFTTLHRLSKSSALFVAVGIPDKVALATSQQIFYGSLVVILVASLLAAAGTWLGAHLLIRTRLEKLVAAARVLGEAESGEVLGTRPQLERTAGQFGQVVTEMRVAIQKATGRQADFAAMIAHDLRNPLQTIDLAVRLLPQASRTKQGEQLFIDMIHRGCEELTQTLNEFLDFSKYRAGYLQLEKETFDLREFLGDLETQYSWRMQQKHIRLQLDMETATGSITGDRKKLHRVLDNLLSNALKFTHEEGEICIGARESADGIELWVKDTGMGIAQADINNLFSLYRQADSARSSSERGTGLGLLICKMIVDAHDGQISVESELGKGTTFRLWLPRSIQSYLATGTSSRLAL